MKAASGWSGLWLPNIAAAYPDIKIALRSGADGFRRQNSWTPLVCGSVAAQCQIEVSDRAVLFCHKLRRSLWLAGP